MAAVSILAASGTAAFVVARGDDGDDVAASDRLDREVATENLGSDLKPTQEFVGPVSWIDSYCLAVAALYDSLPTDEDDHGLQMLRHQAAGTWDALPLDEKVRLGLVVTDYYLQSFRSYYRSLLNLPQPTDVEDQTFWDRFRQSVEATLAELERTADEAHELARRDPEEFVKSPRDKIDEGRGDEVDAAIENSSTDAGQIVAAQPELSAAARSAPECVDWLFLFEDFDEPSAAPSPSASAPASVAGFVRYVNPRFHYSVDVPASFTTDGDADNGDGRVYRSPDELATLRISGGYNVEGTNPQEFLTSEVARLEAEDYVLTLKRVDGDVVTISGLSADSSTMVYLRCVVRPTMTTLLWIYPSRERGIYDPMVERSANSLSPGAE